MEISIGELSRRTGVKVPTIRYYESVALMPAPLRSEGQAAPLWRGRNVQAHLHSPRARTGI
jgi:MerR family regulatory protein